LLVSGHGGTPKCDSLCGGTGGSRPPDGDWSNGGIQSPAAPVALPGAASGCLAARPTRYPGGKALHHRQGKLHSAVLTPLPVRRASGGAAPLAHEDPGAGNIVDRLAAP
jgi:hypothetical protein